MLLQVQEGGMFLSWRRQPFLFFQLQINTLNVGFLMWVVAWLELQGFPNEIGNWSERML